MNAHTMLRGLIIGAAVLVGMPMGVAAKCRQINRSEPLPIAYFLDGRQFSKVELEANTQLIGSIEAVHILCWNAADSTFSMSHGTAGDLNVIRIVTSGLVDRLVAALYRAAEAGSRDTSPPAGGPPTVRAATDDEVVVELSADKTQWSATLKRGSMVHRCVLDVSRPSMPATEIQRTCDFSIAQGEKYVMTTEG